MPQTNKAKTSGGSAGEVSGPESGEPPPARAEPRVSQPEPDRAGESERSDPIITKSLSDPKKYRYIELSNGLKALLISDLTQSESNRETVAEEEEDSDEEEDGDSALCISVGSFSDLADLPGLAHFLEHMVFMGSEKYPSENGFDAFLKKHGGSDNASTDCERTISKFDVQRKYLREALDRWAQFFSCPLMIPDAGDREVEAVDSEYQMAQPLDSYRKEMLFGSLAKAGHPMSKFFWGNAQTLKNEPKEKNINTYERLREFWRRYYSAHYMTLAVQSKETLDTLEEWVREIFIKIPNNGQPRIHVLTISWALPPQGKHYRVKPLHYISWLIGHEGAGSILLLLLLYIIFFKSQMNNSRKLCYIMLSGYSFGSSVLHVTHFTLPGYFLEVKLQNKIIFYLFSLLTKYILTKSKFYFL
uniref:Nardilysin b (N-arginine dibasic convertase) n=1 Tax=Sinocyclocheilus anshuiensis TaxID=1608454 RepID=A0A671T071_9TELE